jgi:sensor histidine kinase YesM
MDNQRAQPKKDDTMMGFVIVAGILIIIVGFVFLLSRQQSSHECTPVYNPDGTVQTGCDALDTTLSPTPVTSVDLLDQLNEGQVSEVDKKLQEAADEFMNQQKAQQQKQQQQTQQQIPPMPGQ